MTRLVFRKNTHGNSVENGWGGIPEERNPSGGYEREMPAQVVGEGRGKVCVGDTRRVQSTEHRHLLGVR